MPVPISIEVRRRIQALRLGKTKLSDIAKELNLSFWTVRNLSRKFRDYQGEVVSPNYRKQSLLRCDKLVWRAALFLKRRHPLWGAGFVLCVLRERYPDKPMPHKRTVLRWWKANGLSRPRGTRFVPQEKQWAKQVHDVWQMDAKSHLRLSDQSGASWLMLTDEASGAVLSCHVFPPADLGEDHRRNCAGRFADCF